MNQVEHAALMPEVTDVNRPFWDGCAAGELRLQTCNECGRCRYPDAPICPACLSDQFTWRPVSGRGKLWSWIVMHQRYFSAFADELPYLVAFIELEEGPKLISTLVDPPAELRCDLPVRVVFEQVAGDRFMAKFEVVGEGGRRSA